MAPIIKEQWELAVMREAGRIAAGALDLMRQMIKPGVTTRALDAAAEDFIRSHDAKPTFKGYKGYPASICASIDEAVVHGIPSDRKLREGEIVSIDVAATHKNYVGDLASTFPVGEISARARKILDATRGALEAAIAAIGPGVPLTKVSSAIQQYAESRGYSVVKKFVGHGIGSKMHEDPQVPNFVIYPPETYEVILKPGIVIAIEPMLNEGTDDVKILKDNWTVVTKDGKLSAHFEHTVAVTESGREIMTLP